MELRRLYLSALDHILGEMEALSVNVIQSWLQRLPFLTQKIKPFLDVKSTEPPEWYADH